MQNLGWYGSPPVAAWRTRMWSCKVSDMTAIASIYLPSGFIVAADGRAKSDSPSLSTKHETEHAQKIFPIKNGSNAFACALSGFAGSNNGKFRLVDEIIKTSRTLINRRFDDGGIYIQNFCHHLQRATSKSKRDGTISEFPPNEHLPPDIRNNLFRLIFAGYFREQPWYFEARFMHNEQDRIRFVIESAQPVEAELHIIGSDIVANAMYTNNDPRFARYSEMPANGSELDKRAEYLRGYIEACSDPIALELDPLCNGIGGHIHVAEVTPGGGFQWRIAPLPPNPEV